MAYGIDEYPFTNMHDTNLLEILCLAKKLKDEYDGLVSRITTLEGKINGYESYIDRKVSAEVDADIAVYQASVTEQLNQMNSQISTFKSQMESKQTTYQQGLDKKLEDFRTQVNKGIEAHRKEYESAMNAMRSEISESVQEMKGTIQALVNTTKSTTESLLTNAKNDVDNIINKANQNIDDLFTKAHEHIHKVIAYMRADFNQLKAQIFNRQDAHEERVNKTLSGMSKVLDNMVEDVETNNSIVEQNKQLVENLSDEYDEFYDKVFDMYGELKEEITRATSPSGYLTNPMTGEIQKADDTILSLYNALLYNHIPDVETMGKWSPKVSEMENDRTPLKETSVNFHPWYEEPRSPITGKRETLRGQHSALHRNPDQKDNNELKELTIEGLKDSIKDYGDFKTTENADEKLDHIATVNNKVETMNVTIEAILLKLDSIQKQLSKVDTFDERIKALEGGGP